MSVSLRNGCFEIDRMESHSSQLQRLVQCPDHEHCIVQIAMFGYRLSLAEETQIAGASPSAKTTN